MELGIHTLWYGLIKHILISILNNAQRLYKKAYEMLSAGFIYCKIKGEKSDSWNDLFQLNTLESVKFSFESN